MVLVGVHTKAFLTRKRSRAKLFWAPSYFTLTFLQPTDTLQIAKLQRTYLREADPAFPVRNWRPNWRPWQTRQPRYWKAHASKPIVLSSEVPCSGDKLRMSHDQTWKYVPSFEIPVLMISIYSHMSWEILQTILRILHAYCSGPAYPIAPFAVLCEMRYAERDMYDVRDVQCGDECESVPQALRKGGIYSCTWWITVTENSVYLSYHAWPLTWRLVLLVAAVINCLRSTWGTYKYYRAPCIMKKSPTHGITLYECCHNTVFLMLGNQNGLNPIKFTTACPVRGLMPNSHWVSGVTMRLQLCCREGITWYCHITITWPSHDYHVTHHMTITWPSYVMVSSLISRWLDIAKATRFFFFSLKRAHSYFAVQLYNEC